MLTKCFHRAIKRLYRSVGSGEHDAAFHGGKHIGCQGLDIGACGQLCSFKASADGVDPSAKILSDELVRGTIFRVDFQRKTPERTAICASVIRMRSR